MSKISSTPRSTNRSLLAVACVVGMTALGTMAAQAASDQTVNPQDKPAATSSTSATEKTLTPDTAEKAPDGDNGALPLAAHNTAQNSLDGTILGKPVYSKDGKEVGEVADVIMVDGKARLVNVAHGGLLGIGQKHAEVTADKVSASKDGVVVKMTADQLAEMPDVGDPMETN